MLVLILTLSTFGFPFLPAASAQPNILKYQGRIELLKIEGLQLIEKGLILSTISTQQGDNLSASAVSEDIKSLYKLGYFTDINVLIEKNNEDQLILTFLFKEKPRIGKIEIKGNTEFSTSNLKDKLKVFPNNMVNIAKIETDVRTLLGEYRKKGYMQTLVTYEFKSIDESEVDLIYNIDESPKVFLTDINIYGTEVYPPLDIERLLISAEIDCFSSFNNSGVFEEAKVNQDLQIITQHYLQNGYIKVKIDKPKAVLIRNRDYSKVVVDLNITEGDQYFTGDIEFVAQDGNELLFDQSEMLESFALQKGEVYNPFKQNKDRFKITDIYLERGYAFSKVRVSNDIDEVNKIVNIKILVTRGEKAYIGRVEIQGNYETLDSVIRRELEIHDNELYNGVKLRESQRNINRLGFFKAGTGVRMEREKGEEENTLDYDVILEEGQTGTFNASITYSGDSGFALILSVSKKNLFGTGKTASVSMQLKDQGDSRYDFSITNPYFLDTRFTNTFSIFSTFTGGTYYDTRTNGFNLGFSYPIWKDWSVSSAYSWKDETYENITSTGEILLDNDEKNTFRAINLGVKYSTVDHPLFPSNGTETSLFNEQVGGSLLGGTTEYRSRSLTYRYFKTLNEEGTFVFGVKFNWSFLEQSNPDKEIPHGKRYTIGGVTSVRGFDWNEIEGPSSDIELPDGWDLSERWPYQAEYMVNNDIHDQAACNADPVCATIPKTKNADREYFETHTGGIEKRVLNLQMYFPLTREGKNIRGLIFYDAGNVWAEDRMYEITENERNDFYYRQSIGTGVNLVTPMGVLRFEYGLKLDRKDGESAGRFDFHISGLF